MQQKESTRWRTSEIRICFTASRSGRVISALAELGALASFDPNQALRSADGTDLTDRIGQAVCRGAIQLGLLARRAVTHQPEAPHLLGEFFCVLPDVAIIPRSGAICSLGRGQSHAVWGALASTVKHGPASSDRERRSIHHRPPCRGSKIHCTCLREDRAPKKVTAQIHHDIAMLTWVNTGSILGASGD